MATNPPQISEYVVATFQYNYAYPLAAEPVNALIQQGWQPFGGVSTVNRGADGTTIICTQAMVRYKTSFALL